MDSGKCENINQYIARFDGIQKELLEQLRSLIHETVPEAQECISYQMPAFRLKKILVYFAAYDHHIGFYPGANAIVVFQEELKSLRTSRGAIQFPLEKPLPLELIRRMVVYCRQQIAGSGKTVE
jgi:uncharacterized protein YdhG (YjbR/CyaY superfamily)